MLRKIYQFYDQVKQEAFKINWLSRKDLVRSTLVVLATVTTVSLVFLSIDFIIHKVVNFLLILGNHGV